MQLENKQDKDEQADCLSVRNGKTGRWAEGISESLMSESGGDAEREQEEQGRDLRGKTESLHSTFLCELTGLDAQLTGLF